MKTQIFQWYKKHLCFTNKLNFFQVNSLHLHLVDMKAIGPTFKKLDYKNCPLNAVLKAWRMMRGVWPFVMGWWSWKMLELEFECSFFVYVQFMYVYMYIYIHI